MYKFLFLLLFTFIFSCYNGKSKNDASISKTQSTLAIDSVELTYKPFKLYNYDTMKYLKDNFVDHKAYYLNKPLKILIEKLEIEIMASYPHAPEFENSSHYVDGLNLEFRDIYTNFNVEKLRQKRGILNIKLQNHFSLDSLNMLKKSLKYNKAIEAFYSNMVVADIVTTWEYYYFPLKTYKNNSLAYIEDNFVDNKQYFINNKIGFLLQKMEIKPDQLKPLDTIAGNPLCTSGISMYFYEKNKKSIKQKTLQIYFDKPINIDSLDKLKEAPPKFHDFRWKDIYNTTKIKDIKSIN
jgi:hypothetical protein